MTPSTPDAASGVDVRALTAFVDAELPGRRRGPLRVELLSGGRSNLTYLVEDDAVRWVLRRPPLGHVLATAHDMSREYRVLSALRDTDVPVPRTLALSPGGVLDAPFYLMEFAAGTIYRDASQLRAVAALDADALSADLVRVLCTLHSLDPASVGLGDLGRPEGYLARQVRRWSTQLEASRSREVPGLTDLAARLAASVPPSASTGLVHGDYRLDNVVVDGGPSVVAVLDWEMATLGDPLTDLASTVVWWDGISGLDSPVAAVPGEAQQFPGSDRLVEAYVATTGADVTRLPWYLGFAFYKVAAIFEGIHYRYLAGLTVGDGFDRLGAMVPALVDRGHEAIAGDRP